jgi:hypothetical protein
MDLGEQRHRPNRTANSYPIEQAREKPLARPDRS